MAALLRIRERTEVRSEVVMAVRGTHRRRCRSRRSHRAAQRRRAGLRAAASGGGPSAAAAPKAVRVPMRSEHVRARGEFICP